MTKRRAKIQINDRVLCCLYNPITQGPWGRPFEGVVEDFEGAMYLVRRKGAGYLEPLQRKEIIAALPATGAGCEPQGQGENHGQATS